MNAELMFISSLMNAPGYIDKTRLTDEHFTDPQAKLIFYTYKELLKNFPESGVYELTNELHSKGWLERAGGAGYLTQINTATISGAKIEYFENEVIENWAKNKIHLLTLSLERDKLTKDSTQLLYDISETIELISGNKAQKSLHIHELMNDWVASIGKKYRQWTTGINDIDNYTMLRAGELFIIAAGTSVGKSNLALNIMLNSDQKITYVNAEMASESVMTRMIANYSGIPNHDIRRMKENTDNKFNQYISELVRYAGEISEKQIYVTKTSNIEDALIDAKINGSEIVILDYLQLLRTSAIKENDIYSRTAYISNHLKKWAVDNDVCVILLSQFNRQMSDRPSMSQMKGGSDIEQAADVVLVLVRDKENRLYFGIDKNRNGPLTENDIELSYNPEIHKIANMGAF